MSGRCLHCGEKDGHRFGYMETGGIWRPKEQVNSNGAP